MGEDYRSAGPDDEQFDKTRWSMDLGGVRSQAPRAQKAELCGLHWRPFYAFARRRGHSPEDAQDLVQGFFEHFIGSRLTPETLYDAEWALLLCAPAPSALSRNSSPFHRNTKNANSSPAKKLL